MPALDLTKLTVDQLNAVVNEALRLKRERADGVPTTDPEVVKMAAALMAMSEKLKVDVAKIVVAVGRNLQPAVQFRAYAPLDPNAPKKTRKKK